MVVLKSLHFILFSALMSSSVFAGDPPHGHWPDPNANTKGEGSLDGTFRYNANKLVPLAIYGPQSYVSFVLHLDTGQYAWSISNGTWGPRRRFKAVYPWPVTFKSQVIPAEMTVPALRGHDWVMSQLMLEDGIDPYSDFIAGGLIVNGDGRAEPRFVSGSNSEINGHAVDRFLVPKFADILDLRLREVAEGREIMPRSECPYWQLVGQ